MDALYPTLAAGLAVLVGGMVQGCIGFGFGMISLTPLLFIMNQREAVPALLILSMLNTAPIALSNRDKIRASIVAPLLGGAVIGVPIGVAAILYLEGPVFGAAVGLVLLTFAVVLAAGWGYPLPRPQIASLPVGFLSGIMNGSTSMGGPPVVLFLANQAVPRDVFRTNIVTYFSCTNVVSIALMAGHGLIDGDLLARTALLAPLLIAGTYAGSRISRHTSEKRFKTVTLACAAGMGLLLLIRNGLELLG